MGGNGVDIGAVYQLLSVVAETVTRLDRSMAVVERRLASIEERLDSLERRTSNVEHSVVELRETVTHYHSSVVGHGILISEMEARLRFLEDSKAAH